MANTLLADNGVSSGSAGIKYSADGTGVWALQTTTAGGAATTAVTISTAQVVTLANALPMASGGTGVTTMPAFNAYSTSGTAMSNGVYVKVTFDTEKFDTNSNFASSRFTPTVAGYYQVNSSLVYTTTGTVTQVVLALYKNGAVETYTNFVANSSQGASINLSYVINMNGSTDYVEMYCYLAGTGTLAVQGGQQTAFNGAMIRSL
jgi:hypothetical protein